ncbi:glutamate--cysteine ligase [Arthrobacter sp. 35W]|uniref:glutamate--cysteine ligase n=1 Tax=Arthrobacter sp. 35W TaxID=1132441 RepID=UPI0004263EF5|nr:glutamate--cysteine ligase [Arthrobacter sp. 35W]
MFLSRDGARAAEHTAPLAAPAEGVHNDGVRTFGVEEELLIVDPSSGVPMPLAHAILAEVGSTTTARQMPYIGSLQHEFKLEQIEAATAPSTTFAELEAGIRNGRLLLDDGARRLGARIAATATPPVPTATHTFPSERYRSMVDRFGLTAVEQITCGFHVHVAIHSAAEGVAVMNGIRPWLPILLALSANSPYWGGHDTGYASYRTQVWGRWPATGPAPHFHSLTEYRNVMNALVGTGVLLDEGMVYFDARLSRNNPTVEVRIADVCLDAADAVLIAILVRALVRRAANDWLEHRRSRPVPTPLVHLGSWMGSLWGVQSQLLHPAHHTPCPAAEAAGALFNHVEGHLAGSAERAYAESGLTAVLVRGSGERAQRRAVERFGRLSDAVAATWV